MTALPGFAHSTWEQACLAMCVHAAVEVGDKSVAPMGNRVHKNRRQQESKIALFSQSWIQVVSQPIAYQIQRQHYYRET